MSEQFYTILTKIGKAKIANSAALGNQVNLVKFQIGDGNGAYYSPSEDQTQLKNKVWEGNISSVRVDDENPNWIVLETLIPGTDGGFMVREAAAVDNEGNLIAIGKYPETYKPVAGDGSIKDLIIKMIIEVSNTSAVTLKVDPTVILATQNDILSLDKKISKNTSDIKILTNRIDNLKLVDTKVKLTDPDDIFGLGEDANVNQALLSNKTSILKHDKDIENLKSSASNGKNLIATAITGKGVSASGNDSFNILASKIDSIKIEKHSLPDWFSLRNSWISCASMPSGLQRLNGGLVNDNIYIIYNTINQCYNTRNNTWSNKTAMPTPREYTTTSSLGNNIYCVGGGSYTGINECYDTVTNTWSTKTSMPTGRRYASSSVVGSNIYFIGGAFNSGSYSTINECYDTLSDIWSTKTSMPTGRYDLTTASVGSNIYCIGGYTGGYSSVNECYDTLTNTWSTKTKMSAGRERLTSSVVDGKIYCIGGYNGSINDRHDCYDTVTDTWSTKTKMLNSRYGLISEVVDNIIYCIGGAGNPSGNECYVV